MALCDVYDALRRERPCKSAWPDERALARIHEQSGLHFDPERVAILEVLIPDIEAIRQHLGHP